MNRAIFHLIAIERNTKVYLIHPHKRIVEWPDKSWYKSSDKTLYSELGTSGHAISKIRALALHQPCNLGETYGIVLL